MGQTDIDKLIGNEAEDVVPKHQVGTFRDRAAEMPADDALPTRALPMKETPKPFNIKGGGNGG